MKTFYPFSVLSLCLMLASGAAQAQAPAYTIQDLGTLGGGLSGATAINSNGDVVGYSYTADGSARPFLYSHGVMQDLGTIYGPQGYQPPYPEGDRGLATAINDKGQITGMTYKVIPRGDGTSYFTNIGFRYSNGTMTEFDSGSTFGLNNVGQSVGRTTGARSDALLNSNGVDIDIDPKSPGNGSTGYGINNHGQVAGDAVNRVAGTALLYLPFTYQKGKSQYLDLPTGYDGGRAYAVSDSGLVAGLAQKLDGSLSGLTHAALWKNGQAFDLGTLGGTYSAAYGVNSAGVVVGEADRNLVNHLQSTAFVYKNGVMYDLFAGTAWFGGNASAINDAGQIVGTGIYNGQIRAFLATPVSVLERALSKFRAD